MLPPSSPSSAGIVASQTLARLGAYLDAVETGRIPCQPKRYQTVAKAALALLAANSSCPDVLSQVALSPALQEARSTMGLSLAITVGLVDLPEAVVGALR